jgi:hypothetical protein
MAMENMRNDSFSSDTPMKCESDAYPGGFDADGDFCSRRISNWVPLPPNRTESIDPEVTVKSRLHWLSVMKEWEWEILLG